MSIYSCRDELICGIKQLKLIKEITNCNEGIQTKVTQLLEYLSLLKKWNKTYSLTAITNIHDMIKYHILDGLSIIPYLGEPSKLHNVIDIGSGMGIPGIIISIWYPELRVTLLDSNKKKTAFLQQVAIELKLNNVDIQSVKVEDYYPIVKFDVVVSRAFAESSLFLELAKHLVKPDGFLIAMKGQNLENELSRLPANCKYDIVKVAIPGLEVSRFLLKMKMI